MKIFVVLLAFTLALPAKGQLINEIRDRLATLKATVEAEIERGRDTISSLIEDVLTDEGNNYANAQIELDQEWADIWLAHLKVKELAVGYDIGMCLQFREDVILRLPQRCRDDINTCYQPYNADLGQIPTDTERRIGAFLQDVARFGDDIDRCEAAGSDILCLSPIDTNINLAQTEIPEQIRVEVDGATQLIDEANTNIKQCIDDGVSYMANGYEIVDSIAVCVNNIMQCGGPYC